ncbi:hypothetical protein JCM10212_002693 [Sporobolomyces blumeae]
MDARIHLAVSHSGRTLHLSVSPRDPFSSLLATLETEFSVSRSTAKLVVKGKKLQSEPSSDPPLHHLLPGATFDPTPTSSSAPGRSPTNPIKILLVGPKVHDLDALRDAERLREKKHAAFAHHQAVARTGAAKPTRARRVYGLSDDDPDRYRFYELGPFPKRVPQFDRRKAMLERLAGDEAVRDVMRRHKFAVGVLTELHPILQPTLLGLNTNSGEKVSLRLLTDDMEGCRNYNEVRRVLLHELSHNRFGDHDDNFKELNSQLNKEVSAFESSPYFEPWSPSPSSSSEPPSAHSHRLNEEEAERVWDKLNFGLEEELEMRRDRVGRAAEDRMKKERARQT